jgi:hypothetical protein
MESTNALTQSDVEPIAERISRVLKARAKNINAGTRTCLGHLSQASREELLQMPLGEITWDALFDADEQEPGTFALVWERMLQVADDGLQSGHRAAAIVTAGQPPMAEARFLVLLRSFVKDWEPENSIEMRLIEAMAQAWMMREHWFQIAMQRVSFECERESWRVLEQGKWAAREADGGEELRQALEYTDKFDRVYLRTVRSLRDLRRYSAAVTINNAKQVNIALDGGQQTNVGKSVKGKKRKARPTMRPGSRKLQAVK